MRFLLAILAVLTLGKVYPQGCSDAGFCTMGAMRPDQNYNKRVKFKVRSIEYNYYEGKTPISPVISAHTLEFNASLGELNSVQVKVPYMFTSGNLGDNSGVGDISVSYTRSLTPIAGGDFSGTIGAKIPSGNSTSKFSSDHTNGETVDLPMYYQVTLGSWDAVGGVSWITKDWLFATGIQVALTENENQFQWSDWPNYPDQDVYLKKNNVGRQLKRGTDVMFRAERNFRFTNFNFSFGVLPIYRITKDEAFMPTSGKREKIPKTTGLALSVLASAGYNLNVSNAVKLIYGYKLVDRKVNPDGLTRDNVLSFSYIYRF